MQYIVFDSLGDVAECLRALLSDPDLEVVRVKNRFARRYPPAVTAGYRDIAVQVRLAGAAAAAAGGGLAAGHVCELQLLLAPFARAKGQSGHRRYIAYRNAMGF